MPRTTRRLRLSHPIRRAAAAIGACIVLGGCAATADNPEDPWENFNRGVFSFNQTFDDAVGKPVAEAYGKVTPDPLDAAISNFFGNLADVGNAVNNLLQLKLLTAFEDVGRIAFNSTLGMAGTIDFASGVGFAKHNEDFGQTLGYWGLGPGPYLMLPILGPSTVRDAGGRVVDSFVLDPVSYVSATALRVGANVTRAVDIRHDLLRSGRIISEAALDEYNFIRDAYLQRRESLIKNGERK